MRPGLVRSLADLAELVFVISSPTRLTEKDSYKVVPKFYSSEGQPRSSSDEFPSRVVFENSRQFQYGGCSFDTISRERTVKAC